MSQQRDTLAAGHIIMACAAIFMGLMCVFTFWWGDDGSYAYSFVDSSRISTLSEALASQAVHWQEHTGRFAAHVAVQLLCGNSAHLLFGILDAIVWWLLLLITVRLSGINPAQYRKVAVMTALLIIITATKTTPSTQIGYIWSASACLWTLHFFNRSSHSYSTLHKGGIYLLALLAGNMNETFSLGMAVALIALSLRRGNSFRWTVTVLFCTGTLLCVGAPGNFVRLGETLRESAGTLILHWLLGARAEYLLLLTCLGLHFGRHISWRDILRTEPALWIMAAVSAILIVIVGTVNLRILMGVEIPCAIILFRLLSKYSTAWNVISGPVRHTDTTPQPYSPSGRTRQRLYNILCRLLCGLIIAGALAVCAYGAYTVWRGNRLDYTPELPTYSFSPATPSPSEL